MVDNASSNTNPLKYPSIGFYTSFKLFLEMLLYILKYAYRGIIYIFKDLPSTIWNRASKATDEAYKSTKYAIEKKETKPKKKNILTMDLGDLFASSALVKKRIAKLEKEKVVLQRELQGSGAIRNKESRVYQFTAKNKEGKLETGVMSSYSKLDLHTFLVQEGYDVYKIESNRYIDLFYGQTSLFAPKLKTKDLLFWLTQLATYIKSGITLTESIKILNHQMGKNPTYKRAFQSIIYELTMGESFSRALEKQGSMFPPLLINMIKAAEATGELEATLDDMAEYYDEMEKTRKQMISALTYPTVILLFSLAVVTFILIWVIPQFVGIYASANANIPKITSVVMSISNYLQYHLTNLIILITVIVTTIVLCYKKIKAFRKQAQTLVMKLPVIGKIVIYNEMTIFTKTFSSLLRNNVFITESIDILSRITNNEIYKEIMYNTIQNVIKGEKISTAFKDHWAIPDVAYYMIVTGESTGELASMMAKVSNYYQEMHKSAINNLKAFIEPTMIVVLALVVGTIILSVIIPMFGLMNEIQM